MGAGASDPDSDRLSTIGEATCDWCKWDLGSGLPRAWVAEEVLERCFGAGVSIMDTLETGLRVVADLGDKSSIDFAFALPLSFFLRLVLTSSLETDTLRLRFRP